MDLFSEARRLTIVALFADDVLLDQIVLKGATALNVVYRISKRVSLDVDFSRSEMTFLTLMKAESEFFRTLKDRFDSFGYVVFDENLRKSRGSRAKTKDRGGEVIS
jgi:predicted nucleotidyltransferase component of viral defense system